MHPAYFFVVIVLAVALVGLVAGRKL